MRRFAAVMALLLMAAVSSPAGPQQKEEVKKLNLPTPQKGKGRGYVPLTPERRAHFQAISKARHGDHIQRVAASFALPAKFDARDRVPLPVWDQGQCVIPGSKVTMGDGSRKAIEEIRPGELIRDVDGQVTRVNWVTSRQVDEEIVGITAGASTLWVTADHPVFVNSCGTVPAGKLTTADNVLVDGNRLIPLEQVARKRYSGKVYNLIVSRSETYIVNGICVHNCGSCYLVSTVRNMTCAGILVGMGKSDNSFVISPQFGMDSPRDFGGCNGGNGTEVIDWACKNGWVAEKYTDASGVKHNDYPAYQASEGRDRTAPGAKKDWVKGWTWGYVNANGNPTTDEIKAALFLYGRLNIALDAGGQFSNGTGTITSLGSSIDHEICMVGWDDGKDGGCFIIENQWGADWGNGGYRYLTYGAAKQLVDIFFVSAGTVPPPPPDPPGPTPGSITITITISGAEADKLRAQLGTGTPVTKDMTLGQLMELLKKSEAKPKNEEPPMLKAPLKMLPPEEVRAPQMRDLTTTQLLAWYAQLERLPKAAR